MTSSKTTSTGMSQRICDGVRVDADEVGVEAGAFVELDEGGDVGELVLPAGVLGAVLDGVGVDAAAAAGLAPFDVPAEAGGAEVAGVEVEGLAVAAEGEPELVVAAAVPVALGLGAGRREGLPVSVLGHGFLNLNVRCG